MAIRSPHDSEDSAELRAKRTALSGAIFLTFLAFLIQIGGAWYTGSLALLGDTAHLFTDLFSLIISLLAVVLSLRPTTSLRSFGLFRLEVLAAFVNGLLLVGTAAFLAFEAVERLWTGAPPVRALPLMVVAAIGLLLNLLSAYMLSRAMVGHAHHGHGHGHDHGHDHDHAPGDDHGHGHNHHQHGHAHPQEHDRNLRAAFLHVLSDALSSVAVVAGAVLTHFTGWAWVDAALALILAFVIARWSWRLVQESAHVLLESTPRHLDAEKIRGELRTADSRVLNVEDLHVWEITSRMYAATAEVEAKVTNLMELEEVRKCLHEKLRDRGIGHVVLEIRSR